MKNKKAKLASGNWEEVKRLFEVGQALDPSRHRAWLDEVTAGRPEVRAELESLLEVPEARQTPFDHGVLSVVDLPLPGESAGPSLIGRQLGRYRIVGKLGSGGSAAVYRGVVEGTGGFEKPVAVKSMHQLHDADPEIRKLFEYEAKLSSLLTHANIVQVFDFFSFEGTPFLIMEFVEGGNLSEVLSLVGKGKGRVPRECALFIANEVTKGLDYAHTRVDPQTGAALGIVHRDISPKNVMLSSDGAVKLVDFGIAVARGRGKVTQTGSLRGTVQYMSPEQASGAQPDARSDLYALTAILYELLSGKPLINDDDILTSLRAIADGKLASSSVKALDLPSHLRALLLRGLAKDPRDRFQTAAELHAELDPLLRDHSTLQIQDKLKKMVTTFSFSPAATGSAFAPTRLTATGKFRRVLLRGTGWTVALGIAVGVALTVFHSVSIDEKTPAETQSKKDIPKSVAAPVSPPAEVLRETVPAAYQEGVALFEKGLHRLALESFRKCRTDQPDYLPAWWYELKTLSLLKRSEEAKAIAETLVKTHPELNGMSELTPYLH